MSHKKKIIFISFFIFICLCAGICAVFFRSPPPTVSVVMSTYNRAYALPTSIDSILSQTYGDFEFIIVNDGSTDNTAQVLAAYADKDKRIRILTNKQNKGLIYSLNRGLDAARGKYIARMDDDDVSLPWRFEREVLAMETYPNITIFGSFLASPASHPAKRTATPLIEDPKLTQIKTYFSSGLGHPTIMMRRDFVEKYHIRYRAENLYAEDCGFYVDVFENGGKLSVIKEPLVLFGVIKNVSRPTKYYQTQQETFKKIQKQKLEKLFGTQEDFSDLLGSWNDLRQKCRLWQKMAAANETKNILDQPVLVKMIEEKCPEDFENALFVKHSFWEDFFILEENNQLYRYSNHDRAAIVAQTDKEMTIKWDNYGTETFKKETPTYLTQIK